MLGGIFKLLRLPFGPRCDAKEDRPWLFPVKLKPQDEDQDLLGTMPDRVVGLSSRANAEALDLKLFWKGQGHLKCMCLLMTKEGKYLRHVWEGDSRFDGIQYRAQQPRSLQAPEIGRDDEEDFLHVGTVAGDSMSLHLGLLPENVFACVFALVGTDEGLAFASDDVMQQFQELTMTLHAAQSQDVIFTYRQGALRKECNIITSLCLYRGPHHTWRLEPMQLHLRLGPIKLHGTRSRLLLV
ncbi:unnamed protein product [Symbiodinium sp. CCMP2592]|nr:unnamed protein product [Symbiodinium sp. CCMP2592]